jgi:ABC-2 type transport system permease protein
VRALVVLFSTVVFSITGLALSGAGLTSEGALTRLLLWMLAVTVYGAFWFALAIAVNALGKNAAANAIALAACWLAFAVVIPAAVNLAASACYPVPSRVEFVNARRVETTDAMARGSQLLARFVEDHPELAPPNASLDTADFGMLRMARDEEVARKLKPVLDRFNAQIARQHAFVNRLRYLSPALLMQEALYDIAGTGRARHQQFLAQVDEHYRVWKAFFAPRVFHKVAITPADFGRFPRFHYQEELTGELAKRVIRPALLLLAVAAIAAWFGLRRYRSYPVVG